MYRTIIKLLCRMMMMNNYGKKSHKKVIQTNIITYLAHISLPHNIIPQNYRKLSIVLNETRYSHYWISYNLCIVFLLDNLSRLSHIISHNCIYFMSTICVIHLVYLDLSCSLKLCGISWKTILRFFVGPT